MRRLLLAAALIVGVTAQGQAQPGAQAAAGAARGGDAVAALRFAQSGAPVIVAPRRIDTDQETVDFAGTVEAAGEVTLTVNGSPLAVAADGAFRVRRTVPVGRSRLVLVARDSRGNRAEKKIYVRRGAAAAGDIEFGRTHALVIGNNVYRDLRRLKTAVADAEAVAALLAERYGYEVTSLINATRYDIVSALARLRARLTENDNLLVYYAGHGQIDVESDEGYWLPVDAEKDNPANWISNATITSQLKAMRARHVLVVADSCYSGTLTRGVEAGLKTGAERAAWLARISRRRSRTALTSGGLEPVLDAGGGEHSVFARAFLAALRTSDEVLDGQSLLDAIKQPVALNADQTPEYNNIRKAGHGGGDFLFAPLDVRETPAAQPQAAPRPESTAMELAFWQTIQSSTDPAMFDEYLRQFPAGTFAGLAKLKRDALRTASLEAERKAGEEAEYRAAEEAKRAAAEEAMRAAAERRLAEQRRQAEAEAKRQAEAEAKRRAEAEAKRRAEEQRLAEAEAKRLAEAEAKRAEITVATLTPQEPMPSPPRDRSRTPLPGSFDGEWVLEVVKSPTSSSGKAFNVKTSIVDNKFSTRFSVYGLDGEISGEIDRNGKLVATGKWGTNVRLKLSTKFAYGRFRADTSVREPDSWRGNKIHLTFTLARASSREARSTTTAALTPPAKAQPTTPEAEKAPFDGLWSGRLECRGTTWRRFRYVSVENGRLVAKWEYFNDPRAHDFSGEFDAQGRIEINGKITWSNGRSYRLWITARAKGVDRIEGWGKVGRESRCRFLLTLVRR